MSKLPVDIITIKEEFDDIFINKELGKVTPYGIYDLFRNKGFVNVGISKDTAEFAVNSIRSWWYDMGRVEYHNVRELLITADCGGSNGDSFRLWTVELQMFANETGLTSFCPEIRKL